MTTVPRPRNNACQIRRAGRDDARLLFDWVNRPDSRAASLLAQRPVAWDEHCRWLDERMADPASRLWIVEVDGRPVGQVRLQDRGRGPEVALFVEERARGRGIATAALALALEEARGTWARAYAVAKVRLDNVASRRLFERAGFRLADTAADHWVFVKPIGSS
jgi:RimJ/RimL family protein N-acetyltransferase